MENLVAISKFDEIGLVSFFSLSKQYGQKAVQFLLHVATVWIDESSSVKYKSEGVFFGICRGEPAYRWRVSFGLVLIVVEGKVTLEVFWIDHNLVFAFQGL